MSDNKEKDKAEKTEKKLSDEEKKTLMVKLQKEIKFYEDSIERGSKYEDIHERHIDFTKALLYGIFYGLIGNLAVQYSLPFYEGIVFARYDMMFCISVLLFFGSVITIFFVTIKLDRELKEEKRKFDEAWADKLASKWTKIDLERLLDYLKNQ